MMFKPIPLHWLRWIAILLALACMGRMASGVDPGKGRSLLGGDIRLIYSGRRFNNLEPCGCQRNQTSGVQYEAAIYRQNEIPCLKLDAGEWTNPQSAMPGLDALKTRYLLRVLHRLKFDAVNVGWSDLQYGVSYFKTFAVQYPQEQPNLVSSNIYLKSNSEQHAFPTHKVIRYTLATGRTVMIGVTGVTEPANPIPANCDEANAFVIGKPIESVKLLIRELRPKVDILIVLHSGPFASCRLLAEAFPQVDCFITTGQASEHVTSSDTNHRVRILCVKGMRGHELGQAMIHCAEMGSKRIVILPESISVNPNPYPDQDIVGLINEYKGKTKDLQVPLPGLKVNETFQGEQGCRQCHSKPYEHWHNTPHAKAMQTLVDRGQQFNPECLGCHTTGYRKDNGFYSVQHGESTRMQNVQCEACHGPALRHAADQRQILSGISNKMGPMDYKWFLERVKNCLPRLKIPESVCRECHDDEHDGEFEYMRKLDLVKHY